MAFLIRRNAGELEEIGLGQYAHIPFLVSRDMDYAEEPNRYLRERALGMWHPNRRDATPYGIVKALGATSVWNYANDLKYFISYLERRRSDWRELSHSDLLNCYDADMASGKLRGRGSKPLAASTINRRISIAIEFLLWASDRALRKPFVVLAKLTRIRPGTGGMRFGATSEIQGRIGMHRQNPKRLRLPSPQELESWLSELRARYGATMHLAVRWVLHTGCRLKETSLVREWQIPDPQTVDLHRPARMEICFGTKGGRRIGDPTLSGTPRVLRFKRHFLAEVDRYRRLRRRKALAIWRANNPGERAPEILFLDERTGKPITSDQIYRAWHNTVSKPFPGWSPHLGRHAFACYALLDILDEEADRLERQVHALPRSHIIARVEDLIRVYLRPILGHVDEKTSELYLEWIADHLLVAEHRAGWSNFLDDVDEP